MLKEMSATTAVLLSRVMLVSHCHGLSMCYKLSKNIFCSKMGMQLRTCTSQTFFYNLQKQKRRGLNYLRIVWKGQGGALDATSTVLLSRKQEGTSYSRPVPLKIAWAP